MYVCYSRSKNESHAKAVLYHLENWGFTMPEEDGEKNIMREPTGKAKACSRWIKF